MNNSDPLTIQYEYNDCDVITNPFVLWCYKPPKALAWLYWEIKIGKCVNGLWDFGFWSASGCSPCSYGRYENYNDAEEKAIEHFKNVFKTNKNSDMCNDKYFNLGKSSFNLFLNRHYFKNKEIVLQDFNMNSKDYVQGSLF